MPSGRLSASLLKRKSLRVGRSMESTPTHAPRAGWWSGCCYPRALSSDARRHASAPRSPPGGTSRSPHTSPSDLTFSFFFTSPAFDKVGFGPRHLRWLLLLLDRCLPPREKELASCWARHLCEIATEELVHPPSKPRVKRGLRCSKLSDQLTQRALGVFGFQENDRCPSTGRLRGKPHGLRKDAQSSSRFRVLLRARTRKLLQETPPGLFLIRRDLPRNQRSPTNSPSTTA